MVTAATGFNFTQTLAIAGVSALAGGGGVGGVFSWLATRAKAKGDTDAATVRAEIEAPADMLAAMAAFQQALNSQTTELTAGLRRELKIANDRLDALAAQHDQCESNLRAVNRRLDDSERQRGDLQRKVEELMMGRVAAFGETAPRD